MELNQKVANFTLQTDEDKAASLSTMPAAGHPLLFPQGGHSGCTIEACGFRDVFKELRGGRRSSTGISRDTPQAQAKFRAKYDCLHTPCDGTKSVQSVWCAEEKNMYGRRCGALSGRRS